MPHTHYSLRTLLVVVTAACVALPLVLHEIMQWTWITVFFVTLCAIFLLPTLASIWFTSTIDRWAENERKAEELKDQDS
jgi:hypothetical protein